MLPGKYRPITLRLDPARIEFELESEARRRSKLYSRNGGLGDTTISPTPIEGTAAKAAKRFPPRSKETGFPTTRSFHDYPVK